MNKNRLNNNNEEKVQGTLKRKRDLQLAHKLKKSCGKCENEPTKRNIYTICCSNLKIKKQKK